MGLFTRTWMCNIFFFQNLHSIIIHRVSMLLEVKLATRHFDSLGGVNVISSSMRKQSLLLSVFRIYHLSPTTSWYTMVKKSFSRVLFKRFSVLPSAKSKILSTPKKNPIKRLSNLLGESEDDFIMWSPSYSF